jgi:hypothetical protein
VKLLRVRGQLLPYAHDGMPLIGEEKGGDWRAVSFFERRTGDLKKPEKAVRGND